MSEIDTMADPLKVAELASEGLRIIAGLQEKHAAAIAESKAGIQRRKQERLDWHKKELEDYAAALDLWAEAQKEMAHLEKEIEALKDIGYRNSFFSTRPLEYIKKDEIRAISSELHRLSLLRPMRTSGPYISWTVDRDRVGEWRSSIVDQLTRIRRRADLARQNVPVSSSEANILGQIQEGLYEAAQEEWLLGMIEMTGPAK